MSWIPGIPLAFPTSSSPLIFRVLVIVLVFTTLSVVFALPDGVVFSGRDGMAYAQQPLPAPKDGNYWEAFSLAPKEKTQADGQKDKEQAAADPEPGEKEPVSKDDTEQKPEEQKTGGTPGAQSGPKTPASLAQPSPALGTVTAESVPPGGPQEQSGYAAPEPEALKEDPSSVSSSEEETDSVSMDLEPATGGSENGNGERNETPTEEEVRAEGEALERGIESLYRLGLKAQKQGRYKSAERHYQAVLRDAPLHFRTRLQLGILHLTRDPQKALDHLRVAERVFPSNASVHYVLGQALEALGADLDAAESYRQAIYRNPRHYNANSRLRGILRRLRSRQSMVQRAAEAFGNNPSVASLTLFGRIVMEQSSPRQAVLEFERVRKIAPDLSEADLWLARALNAAGDTKGEVAAYTRYLERHSKAVGVRLLLVERMVDRGRFRRASELLEPLTQPSGNGGVPPSALGRAAYLRSRLLSARQQPGEVGRLLLEARTLRFDPSILRNAFRSDLAFFPDDAGLLMAYGRFLHEEGDPGGSADALRRAGLIGPEVRDEARAMLNEMLTSGQAPQAVHLAMGSLAFATQDTSGALAHLEHIPIGHALDPEASLLRGRIHRERGEEDAALDAFLRYILHFRERQDIIWARGNLYWELGRADEALTVWNEEPEVLVQHPLVLKKIAGIYRDRNDLKAETATRERLARGLPGNLGNRVRLGELYEAQGRRLEALEIWENVLKERPHDPDLLVRTARGWMGYNENLRGLNLLHLASELRPLGPEDSELLARALYKEQRFEDALTVYWGLYQARPSHPDLPVVLPELTLNVPASAEMRMVSAKLAHKVGRLAQAAEVLEALLQDQPGDRQARELLAVVYLEQDKPNQAMSVLVSSGQESGMGEETLVLMARVQERAGRWMGLASTLEELAQYRPGDADLIRRRAMVLIRLKLYGEARPLLEVTVRARPEDQEARLALARAAQATGDVAMAEEHLGTLLQLDPGNQEARGAIIELLIAGQRWESLPPHLEVWVAAHPKDAKARYNLITAYLKDFRNEDARPHYEVLRTLQPGRARSLAPYFR